MRNQAAGGELAGRAGGRAGCGCRAPASSMIAYVGAPDGHGVAPGSSRAAEQQQQQRLMQLHQLQQQELLQHMQPGQQLQAKLQQLPPEVQLPPQVHPEAQMQPVTEAVSGGQMSQEAHVSGDIQAPADAHLPV
ncbi:hypothetical protein COCOBI_13-3360 [Coccomyxa sp. Obi]|nr:hypothetical protein COCOBI_13-3360 [Coccomyxa sp. Obi]